MERGSYLSAEPHHQIVISRTLVGRMGSYLSAASPSDDHIQDTRWQDGFLTLGRASASHGHMQETRWQEGFLPLFSFTITWPYPGHLLAGRVLTSLQPHHHMAISRKLVSRIGCYLSAEPQHHMAICRKLVDRMGFTSLLSLTIRSSYQDTRWQDGFLPLGRDAISVFYRPRCLCCSN